MPSTTAAPHATPSDTAPRPPRRAVVLVVEDNPGDAELTREGLGDSPAVEDIHVVADGVEALAFLRREPAYAGAPRPDLILLDLNLPRLGGHGVLAALRQDPALHDIPVVVLSSSVADDDVERAYGLGASAYVAKALDLDVHLERLRSIARVWADSAAAA